MRALIRLATAQPSRTAEGILEELRVPRESDASSGSSFSARFEAPDGLWVEGDLAFLTRAFEGVRKVLQLPPRVTAEMELGGCTSDEFLSPDVEERLWLFGRVAAARHAPRARFEVVLGGVLQQASAWLESSPEEHRKVFREDLGLLQAPLERIRVPLGHGDAGLELDLEAGRARIEARDGGALELLELASSASVAGESFSKARRTFELVSATPSDAAAKERRQVEAENLELRTGYLLASPDLSMEELFGRLGTPRVRSFLESSVAFEVPLERRLEAVRALPTPGRSRALVRLLLEARKDPAFEAEPWLDELCAEPLPAAGKGLEDLVLAGFRPEIVSRRLSSLAPELAPRVLARAVLEGPPPVRTSAGEALAALGAEVVARALLPPPDSRVGLEACWSVVEPLLPAGEQTLGELLTGLFEGAVRLTPEDPAASYLAGRISLARGDVEGARRYFQEVGENSLDRSLVARASLAVAELCYQAGGQVEAMESLVTLARETAGQDRREAQALLARGFRELHLPELADLTDPSEGGSPDPALDLVEAWLLGHGGKFPEAVARFRELDQVRPLAGEALRAYAAASLSAGEGREAVELLRRACEDRPEDLEARFQLAQALHRTDQPEASLVELEEALALDPSHPELLQLKGVLCEQGERFEEAATCFEKALGQGASSAGTYSGLARSYIATQRYQEAARVYRRSLARLGAGEGGVLRELGRLYDQDLGDREQALYWYQRHLTQCGEDQEILERFRQLAEQVETSGGVA